MAHYIAMVETADEGVMAAKKYWDESGLDMHIAVKNSGYIAVKTKHWGRIHYIITYDKPEELWKALEKVSIIIERKLIKSKNGPYVYLHKLNEDQTQAVFDQLKKVLKVGEENIERHIEWDWDISNAVLPEAL